MMRAAIIEAPRQIALRDLEAPEPGPGEVRVRIAGCGVCASNLPVYQGRAWFQYPAAPGAPGHEAWGVVEKLGDGVDQWAPGDRVAMVSGNGFAAFDLAPATNLVRTPTILEHSAFPGEPLGCAMNIFARSCITNGQTVAIVGVGFLGAVLVQLGKDAGARVITVARRPWALRLSESLGADAAVSWDDSPAQRVADFTDGAGCECVIECVGRQEALDLATELTAVRGRLVIAGYHQDGARHINMQRWNWHGLDVINAHERDASAYVDGMRAASDRIVSGRLSVAGLITHALPLSELGRAFDLMELRPAGFLKACVLMDG